MKQRWRLLSCFCFCSSMLLVACNRSKPPSIVPVAGRIIRADGTPLTSARVEFWPLDDLKSFTTLPYAMTTDQGEFELLMLDPTKPGAPPGRYRVVIMELGNPKVPTVADRYKGESSPWEVTIPSTGKRDILLKME